MADPKYAGLPGIATEQPDMYETFSDRDTDPVIVTYYLIQNETIEKRTKNEWNIESKAFSNDFILCFCFDTKAFCWVMTVSIQLLFLCSKSALR